ncbi:MAG TPA: hypothetical protein VF806_04280 [Anaerolineaceae bacterium]
MNKDFELKQEPYYSHSGLRQRVRDWVKPPRDTGDETDIPLTKLLPMIPVTGRGKKHKYFKNKQK